MSASFVKPLLIGAAATAVPMLGLVALDRIQNPGGAERYVRREEAVGAGLIGGAAALGVAVLAWPSGSVRLLQWASGLAVGVGIGAGVLAATSRERSFSIDTLSRNMPVVVHESWTGPEEHADPERANAFASLSREVLGRDMFAGIPMSASAEAYDSSDAARVLQRFDRDEDARISESELGLAVKDLSGGRVPVGTHPFENDAIWQRAEATLSRSRRD